MHNLYGYRYRVKEDVWIFDPRRKKSALPKASIALNAIIVIEELVDEASGRLLPYGTTISSENSNQILIIFLLSKTWDAYIVYLLITSIYRHFFYYYIIPMI